MPRGILGTKLGMTQVFTEQGHAVPVTVVKVGPCRIVQRKSVERDGYDAVQIGYGDVAERRVNKPVLGHLKRAGAPPLRWLREFRTADTGAYADLEVGAVIKADLFRAGEYVDVTGTSKGKGFAGVMKRHNFRRGPESHGSMYHRRVGSLGATGPQRVFKGRKLPGRMGSVRRTVQGLKIVRVDADRDLLLIQGSVPGPKGGLLLIRSSVKHKA